MDNESAMFTMRVCLDRNANAASTSLVGGDHKIVVARDNEAWDINATADTTNGALKISVTSEVGKTVKWVAYVKQIKAVG